FYLHGYASRIMFAKRIPWQKMSPEKIRLVYHDFIRDFVIFLYQHGIMPSRSFIETHQDFRDATRVMQHLFWRGYEPVPATHGSNNKHIKRVRFGDGLNAALVISNRARHTLVTTEHIN